MKRGRTTYETTTCDETKPLNFFKLILSPTSQSIKLRIPEKFARAYRDEFIESTFAILTDPLGETWKVKLIKEDYNLWFHDGWQNFVDCYSIDYGYFLLFNYDGNMRFRIHVFDQSTCEISYLRGAPCTGSSAQKNSCNADVGLEQETPKKEVIDVFDELDEYDDDDDNSDREVMESESEEDEGHVGFDGETKSPKRRRNWRRTETVVAREDLSLRLLEAAVAAGVPKPKNPFFVSSIKAYNLSTGVYLTVPWSFAQELLVFGSRLVKLNCADGREFEVKCNVTSKCYLGQGWSIFARIVGLEVGDVCVFELTHRENVIKVHIAKKSQVTAAGYTF